MSAIEKDLSIGATTAQSLSSRFLSQFSQGGCNHMFGKSTIVIALISFKAAPLLFYFFANFFTSSFIAQFLVIFTLLSMDFWIVKNIRFLIDLRWWNFVDADGNDNWKFKSAKDMTQLPAIDRRIFWIGLVVGPAAWTVFVVTAFLTFEFEWMIVALLGALVNLANLWRYLSCHWNHTEQTTKDDKIPMTSLEACKENIKRKFAQDRNALLAFIQYEVAQGESIEDSYKRFCRAFGEDAMKYLDFDFWFYRFMNGQFDLDHDRSKDPVLSELSKMPRELSEKIFGYLDWKDRSTVRKVSRTLRSVVDNSKQYIDKLRLIIECGECTLEVDDQKYSRCINYDHPFPDARIMMALDNLLPILKLPRVEIKRLLISFYYGNQQIVNQFTETLKDAFFTLKQHKVSVKTLEFNVNSQVEVLAEVLPYFKPVVLEEIELVNGGARDGPNIDDLVELEQWKKASTRRAKYVVCSKIESLFHLTDFNAQIPTLTMDDFVRLRETLQASTNFESGTLKLADLVSAENIRNELGNRNVRFDDGFTIQFWNRNNQFYFFKKHRDFGSWNYGFFAECRERFKHGNTADVPDEVYNHFNQVFTHMPLAAIVSKRILCMHGGISPHLKSLDDIRGIGLPLETAKSNPLACDLLWADPEKTANGYEPNKIRAISHIFGKKEVDDLCKRLDIDLIIRGHQVVEYGYAFFADRRLITVFSASRYQDELHNYAAVVIVNKMLELSFVQLKPEEFEKRRDDQDKAGGMNQEQVTANTNEK